MRPLKIARQAGLLFLVATFPVACGSLDQARDAFCARRPDVCDAGGSFDAGEGDAGTADGGTRDAGLTCPSVTGAGAGTVSGTVTNLHTGNPLMAADVWWSAVAGATCSAGVNCVSTDAAGHYTLMQVSAGCVIVSGKTNGYLGRNFDVVIDAGATVPLDFALSTSGTLTGTVRWRDGSGVNGARLSADGGELYTEASFSGDGSGRYNTGYIPIGRYSVTASAPDGRLSQTQSVTIANGTGNAPLDFTLDGGP